MRPFIAEHDSPLTRAALTSTASTPMIVIGLLLFSAALIAVTATLFGFREFAGSGAREA
jgi:hypothetical protein